MITEFKLFENLDDYSTWKRGDIVYCIDDSPPINADVTNFLLRIGDAYTINDIDRAEYSDCYIDVEGASIYLKASRFTKNPKHPILVQKRFDL